VNNSLIDIWSNLNSFVFDINCNMFNCRATLANFLDESFLHFCSFLSCLCCFLLQSNLSIFCSLQTCIFQLLGFFNCCILDFNSFLISSIFYLICFISCLSSFFICSLFYICNDIFNILLSLISLVFSLFNGFSNLFLDIFFSFIDLAIKLSSRFRCTMSWIFRLSSNIFLIW
jgi:hypothetical protein